jgi:hypothetical protein
MSVKVQFTISDEALSVINDSATERKRGEWLSNAVIEYSRLVTSFAGEHSEEVGLLERIDSRLERIEKQVGLLIADRSA